MSNPSSSFRLVSDRAPSGVRYWRVYFRDPFSGKLKKVSTGVLADGSKTSRVEAESIGLRIIEESRKVAPPAPPRKQTFGEFATGFWDWDTSPYLRARLARDPKAISPEHVKNQKSALKCHVEPWVDTSGVRFFDRAIEDITPDHLDELITNVLERGRSTQTAKHVIHAIGPIFEWALRKKVIKVNPVPSMMPFGARSKKREDFTPAEARALLNPKTVSQVWAFPSARQKIYRDGWRMYALSVLCFTTSARWGAVVALNREDIRLEPEERYYEVTLDKSLAELRGVKEGTKTGSGTVVPVAREALDHVLPHLPESGPLFPGWGGHGIITHHPARRALIRAMENVGITRTIQKARLLGHHSWRHTFETRARAAGLSREVRSSFTEHRDDGTADGYAHLRPVDLLSALPVQRSLVAG